MAIDEQFDGYDHESLPSVDIDFSCKSSVQSTQPEAVVDIRNDGQWIRLPTTNVETRVNKDGVADLTATTRVDVPVTWGSTPNGNDKIQLYEYVGAANKEENAEFDVARVYFWNSYIEEYQIKQFGYVASIGPSAENGVFRFYTYDPSDLMKNIAVTKTYDGPSALQVANYVALDDEDGLQANSPINVIDVSTTVPAETVEIRGDIETFREDINGWINDNVPIVDLGSPDFDPNSTFLTDEWLDDALHAGGHKHFRRNRHTLADVMNWLTDEIGGVWYFKPSDNGVTLIVNNGVEDDFKIARSAYYDGNFDPEELEYINGFNPASIDVLNNSSLEDLKPINYLELKGETADSLLGLNRDAFDFDGPIGAARGQTNAYPHVEVRYPPLLERAGGRKIGPKPIDSGKQTLAEAEEEAVKQFKQAHEDNTDGSIEVKSLPSIRPYDYIGAVPVCNDTFDADMNPIQYEVNAVVHKSKGGERYTTTLGVSIALDEDQIEVTKSMEPISDEAEAVEATEAELEGAVDL